MWVPFEELGAESRVWIYQADRKLTDDETELMVENLRLFCEQWEAHGAPLRSSFKIERDQFLILSVDEAWSGASGCSIDGSVRMLKAIGNELKVDFFGRLSAVFIVNDETIVLPLTKLKEALAGHIITADSPTFNTLAATKKDLKAGWIVPLGKTWLAKYLPEKSLA